MSFQETARETQERRVIEKFERELGDACKGYLADDDVVEILLNPDSTLWIERTTGPQIKVGTMSATQSEAIMSTLASIHQTTITRDSPSLSCELPDGSRFQGLIPPVSPLGPTFVIRKHATKIYTLADYVQNGTMTESQMRVMKNMVAGDQNIMVIGPTGSGKTTFVNAIIQHLADEFPTDRLIILEDTREIQSASENVVCLKAVAGYGFDRLLQDTLRMKPRRILLGEVREPKAAQRLLSAWNTGHSGGLTTVHANGAEAGLLRIEALAQEAVEGPISKSGVAAAINCVVAISKAPRRITEILSVHGHDGTRYITTTEG